MEERSAKARKALLEESAIKSARNNPVHLGIDARSFSHEGGWGGFWGWVFRITQGVALGWDMAAPLALSKSKSNDKGKSNGKGKSNRKCKCGGFSTALRFGRNDRGGVP